MSRREIALLILLAVSIAVAWLPRSTAQTQGEPLNTVRDVWKVRTQDNTYTVTLPVNSPRDVIGVVPVLLEKLRQTRGRVDQKDVIGVEYVGQG